MQKLKLKIDADNIHKAISKMISFYCASESAIGKLNNNNDLPVEIINLKNLFSAFVFDILVDMTSLDENKLKQILHQELENLKAHQPEIQEDFNGKLKNNLVH